METEFELIAKTFQGLEEVLAKELTELGANNVQTGHRMVSFTGDKEMMYRANFALRTAIRILKPIKHFKAESADQVYNAVKAIDWTEYLTGETSFAVDSVVFSKEFRHSKFVAYKVKDAIVDFFREKTGTRPNICVTNPDLQLNIHIAENDCTLSLDSSGESLHRRGYRQESVEAPLNEVLAAGMILLTGWHGECDLVDPMCGSGTIPIEAALIARGIAPGVFRKEYAFEKWPDFDKGLFERIYDDDSQEREFTHKIYGYDIHRNAVEIAVRNVKAAGLGKEIEIAQQDFRQFTQPAEKSIMITNPPYGERISAPDLLGLYRAIGERLKHQFQDNEAWILSYREECFDQIGLKPSFKIPLFNGSLECEFRKYQIFSGKYKDMRAEGGELKTEEERKQMAEKRRFKMHREFKKAIDEDESEDYRVRGRGFDDRDDRLRGGRPANRWGKEDRERRFSRRDEKPFGRDRRDYGRDGEDYGRDRRDYDREPRWNGRDRQSFGRDRQGGFDRGRKPFQKERRNSRYEEED